MMDEALRAGLAVFDDAALATLSNPGLVRRAHRDVAEGKVRLVSAGGGRAEVEVDGQAVTLDARGPRAATCACKSVTVCRHRIAAVLFLQAQEGAAETADDAAAPPPPAGTSAETGAPTETPAETVADPGEIIAAIGLPALTRWAGKASWRAALDLAATALTVEASPHAVSVTFEALDGPVRILRGQGLDGIVSKAARAQAKAWHSAAVLAARRHFGLPMPEMPEAPAEESAAGPEIDLHFLDRVAMALDEVAMLGFNLAPTPLQESLFELSVSSRADALPRLAAILRTIAALVRQRQQRALAYDPDHLLELTATAFALTKALRMSAKPGDRERLPALAGKVRRDFAPAGPLDLAGCGGERWQTDSGARGVTAWFIEPASGRWLSATLARGPGQDPGFTPREAWTTQVMWRAEPLAALAHARITLEGSGISADGHLSAPADARATLHARDAMPDPAWPGIIRHWPLLREAYLEQAGIGLDTVKTSAACLLAPATTAAPFFDDLAQQLVWPVRDADGAWLALTLDHALGDTAIAAMEAHAQINWQGMILARLTRAGERLSVQPMTLFHNGSAVDLSLWQRPWRHEKPQGNRTLRNWLARLRTHDQRHFTPCPRDRTNTALAAAWRHLLDQMETGPGLRHALDDTLAAHADRLDSFGLPTLAATLRQDANPLAAAYALMIARQQRCEPPLLQV